MVDPQGLLVLVLALLTTRTTSEYVTVSVPHSSESIMLEGRVGENVSFVCEYPCNCSCLDQEIGAGASCVMHWCVQSTANGLKHCSDDPSPPGAEYKFLDGIAENYPPTKDCDEGNSTRQTSLLEFTAQELHDGLVFSCRVSPHESNAYAYSNPLLLSVTGKQENVDPSSTTSASDSTSTESSHVVQEGQGPTHQYPACTDPTPTSLSSPMAPADCSCPQTTTMFTPVPGVSESFVQSPAGISAIVVALVITILLVVLLAILGVVVHFRHKSSRDYDASGQTNADDTGNESETVV